jgi:hypothetical protein
MSQDTFPFAPGEESPLAFDDGDGGRNKKALIAGGAVVALVLGAGAYLFLGGSSDTGETAFAPVKRAPRTLAAAPKAAAKPAAKKLPVAYKEQIGRDPFRALYVVPVAAVAPAAPGAAPITPTTSGTTAGSTGTTPSAPLAKRYTVKLVSISKPSPEVRFFSWAVDGQKVNVIPGQRFGKYGELVVLAYTRNAAGAATGAVIQVGDDSPMEVKVGESVSVL